MTASRSEDTAGSPPPGVRSVVGASVRGATHVRDGRANQDAMMWYPESGQGRDLVVALADGHGSAKCFRSDAGADMAVSVAAASGREFLSGIPSEDDASTRQRARTELTAEIVDRWRREVNREIEQRPFTGEELARVEELTGAEGLAAVDANPFLAYGATLLLALVYEASASFLQLGDGDILTVDGRGRVSRPLPADPRLFANETTSLCMAGAAQEFRVGWQPLVDGGPDVVVMATDGFANAYPDEEAFLRVGPDVLAHVREDGLPAVAERLEGWLGEASRHSGDDVTAAVIWLPMPAAL